jgi:tetratricopeptide (TPR) repeat protein
MIRLIALCLFCSFLVAQQAEPHWQKLYRQGLQELQAGNNEGAINLLSRAVRLNPSPSSSPRYTPYYYLGLGHDSLGEEKRAAEYYEKSAALGAIAAFTEDYETLKASLQEIKEGARTFGVIVKDRTAGKVDQGKPQAVTTTDQERPPARTPESSPAEPSRKPVTKNESSPPPPPAKALDPKKEQLHRADLQKALLGYLKGDYQGAFQLAQGYLEKGGEQVQKASFLAAASLFSQYLLTGERNPVLREDADRYFRAAGSYKPPEIWISPPLLQYYQRLQSE